MHRFLQKCCHDLDILLWLSSSSCTKVSSFGGLSYFLEENKPHGAPQFCLDGCQHRDACEFYAPKFYLEHPKAIEDGLIYAVSESTSTEDVLESLRKGPYGRCVFQCDNTVVDHQTVCLELENGIDVSLSMCAFTNRCTREIHLMGTKGEIRGNMETGEIEVIQFLDNSSDKITLHTPKTGHSGSDANMMRDFVKLMASDGQLISKTNAEVSAESHLIALAAEQSRLTGKTIYMEEYKKAIQNSNNQVGL